MMTRRSTNSGSLTTDHPQGRPAGARVATLATPSGTERIAERSHASAEEYWRYFPRKLTVSAVGLGTYLGDCTSEDDAAYRASVHAAITTGINVIDTASNYRCQRSERAVGMALEEAIAAGDVRRDEILVCTKGGYVALDGEPPASREAYDKWLEVNLIEPGVLSREDLVRGGHSLKPSFLAHQLAQSLSNLRLRALDIYYLHNPEEQLLGIDRDTFLERMRAAFTLLEDRAAAGEIGGYGCATWTGLRITPDQRQHLSLSDLVALAREIAGTAHHFRAVQMPVNLAMPEGARVPTQLLGRKLVTALEAADSLGLGVVASASLMQGQLTSGLPEQLHELFPGSTTDAQRALRFVSSLPGVMTALAGARSVAHVTENAGAWGTPPVE
jgi:aryl-alcohol dehydrogenase-like predicted oxidoreductase